MPDISIEIGREPVREVDARPGGAKHEVERRDNEKGDRKTRRRAREKAAASLVGTRASERGDREHEPADPLNAAEDGEEGSESVAHRRSSRCVKGRVGARPFTTRGSVRARADGAGRGGRFAVSLQLALRWRLTYAGPLPGWRTDRLLQFTDEAVDALRQR